MLNATVLCAQVYKYMEVHTFQYRPVNHQYIKST